MRQRSLRAAGRRAPHLITGCGNPQRRAADGIFGGASRRVARIQIKGAPVSNTVPAQADIIIIGGGIVGTSVAYHLARRGVSNVVLLERRQLTCGTTWHAAGLVGQLRATLNLTRLAKYTAELYTGLEAETGQATGFKCTGSLAVAASPGRLEELKRGASMARSFGLEVDILSPAQARALWPLLSTQDLV